MPNGTIIGIDSTGIFYYYASPDSQLAGADYWKVVASGATTVSRVRTLMNGSIIGITRATPVGTLAIK